MSAEIQAMESHAHDAAHPTVGTYIKIAVVLFVLTALEVLAYELAHRPAAPLHAVVEQALVPILVVLSAAKFALVAMFYMHLKQDSKIFSGLFVFPLIIATLLVLALIVLMSYWRIIH